MSGVFPASETEDALSVLAGIPPMRPYFAGRRVRIPLIELEDGYRMFFWLEADGTYHAMVDYPNFEIHRFEQAGAVFA